MHIEALREYCLAKAGTSEDMPFDEDTLVFKVCGKMFALCSIADFAKGINLKCDPDVAIDLRERYPQVLPGFHMSKKHWNTVLPEAGLPDELLRQWIDSSYSLVAARLTKIQKNNIGYEESP